MKNSPTFNPKFDFWGAIDESWVESEISENPEQWLGITVLLVLDQL